ncbi:MAG: ribosome-associated translation inhibitor RaiA [Acidobacteria bacterium]|nr:ribosome-associated translation inhibitor RaiA [Acidobacteriota bacterium]
MRLDITGRHVEITAPVRQLITKRFSRLERLLNDAAVSAIITLTKEKYRLRTEIAVHTKGDHVLRGNGEGNAWPISIRQATEKVEQQAQTLKGKWDARKRTTAPRVVRSTGREAPTTPRIVRATRYAVKPMSLDDAALRVDGDGEAFVVFRNAETDAVSILYRRKDGNLGLIEPE